MKASPPADPFITRIIGSVLSPKGTLPEGFALSCVIALGCCAHARAADQVRLITLDPGHFHAALVQKLMYPQVSPVVRVYAPDGPELQAHLKLVNGFNNRQENPTRWDERVYTGNDFVARMLRERAGNVVVLAGNNSRKTDYIRLCINAGFDVLSDKPMAITPANFKQLRKAFAQAEKKNLLLYDIMTERYEINTILQREFARSRELFGDLEQGTAEHPAVEMESVHYFYKEVAGKPLTRPAWFYDVRQQGEAVPDVGTHLIDLVQWECFPDQELDWKKDVKVHQARRWPTKMTSEQFKRSTGLDKYPEFLKRDIDADGKLNVFQNGEVSYQLRGVHAKVRALWGFEAPPGTGDTFLSLLRGTGATLSIKQGKEQQYKPTLYLEPKGVGAEAFERTVRSALERLCATWPGLELKKTGDAWEVVVPQKYHVGHEAHFAQVTEKFLEFQKHRSMPAWEVPNMLAKYYTTTEAYRLSRAAR